jgi:hypothetical protein
MPASKLAIRLIAVLTATAFTTLAGCAADSTDDGSDEETGASTEDALTQSGGRTLVYYLGSSSFLRQCAGNTLGCGRAVASVADSTPYFSAPRTWSRSTCNQWYTFKANGKCVEAQRFEVSDRRNFIEANPGLMKGLGFAHSDGRNCAGSGQATATVTPGRNCGAASNTTTDPTPATPGDAAEDPGAGGCFSATLNKAMPEKSCVQSRSNSIWYQCIDRAWMRGVEGNSGPAGACVSVNPL